MTKELATPTAPPRPLSLQTWRRALGEPRVRFWYLTAIVLIIVILVALASGAKAWRHTVDLIDHGLHIEAVVVQAGEMRAKRPQPPDVLCVLEFKWKGQTYSPYPARLDGRRMGEYITPGDKILLHVNPDDPEDWTSRNEADSLASRLIGRIAPVPLLIVSVIFAVTLHFRILQTWRRSEALPALVLDTYVSAVAPLSRAARVTPEHGKDNRIYTVYLPRDLVGIQRGDPLFILKPSSTAATAVAAAWFE